MNIPFRRLSKTPQEIDMTSEGVTLKGTLVLKQMGLALLEAHLSGKLQLPCDICAEPFDTVLDEHLEMLISDGVFEGSDDVLDVIEMSEDVVDLHEIFHSEIQLIHSDYHSCERCSDQGFEYSEPLA